MMQLFLLWPVFLLPFVAAPVSSGKPAVDSLALTVQSKSEKVVYFSLEVKGEKVKAGGGREPFRLKKNNLKTPYQLDLGDGQFEIVVVRKSAEAGMVSRIQNFRDGEPQGYCENDTRKTVLTGAPGTCSAGGE